jgi:hypothetical protein
MGIENLEKTVDLAIKLANVTIESQKDGFQPMDLLQLIAPATELPAVIAALPKTQEELNELSIDELGSLIARVEAGLTNVPADPKQFILDAVAWAALTYKLVNTGIDTFGKQAVN